jgi:hypothetical protein
MERTPAIAPSPMVLKIMFLPSFIGVDLFLLFSLDRLMSLRAMVEKWPKPDA